MELRLGVILPSGQIYSNNGSPNKTSSLFRFKWPRCIPIPIWQLTSHVQQEYPPYVGPRFFVLPVHNQGASLAIYQGQALWRKFLPATSSFFVLSLLIQTLF